MDGERRGFVDDDDRFILVEDADVATDIRLTERRLEMEIAFASANELVGSDGRVIFVDDASALADSKPFFTRDMRHHRAQTVEQRVRVTGFRHMQRARLVVRHASWQR